MLKWDVFDFVTKSSLDKKILYSNKFNNTNQILTCGIKFNRSELNSGLKASKEFSLSSVVNSSWFFMNFKAQLQRLYYHVTDNNNRFFRI